MKASPRNGMTKNGNGSQTFRYALGQSRFHNWKRDAKRLPCIIISSDESNAHISTIIIAQMTTHSTAYPTRIKCGFQNKTGQIVLDQLRTVNKKRLVK